MKLQIIVTHFDEPIGFVERFLDSVKVQDFIDKQDFEVLIVNDGNRVVIPEKLLTKYDFSIKYFVKNWAGLSAARQYGQNMASADYIMFCDCDDLFLRIDALYSIFKIIDGNNYDLIVGGRLQDVSGQIMAVSADAALLGHEVHNKIYKLAFLQKNNIVWDERIQKWHEDFYFNNLFLSYNPTIYKLNLLTYIWKARQNSVSAVGNSNQANKDEQLGLLMNRYITLLTELKNRGNTDFFNNKLADALLLIYNTATDLKYTQTIRELCEYYANKLIDKFSLEITKVSIPLLKARLARLSFDFNTNMLFRSQPLIDWWKEMSNKLDSWMK